MKLKSYRRKTLAAIQRAVMFGLPVASLLTIASCGRPTHDDQKAALVDQNQDKKKNSVRESVEGTGERLMGKVFIGDAKEGKLK